MRKNYIMTTLKIGMKIKYECAAGKRSGVITDIFLGKNGKGELIPWMLVDTDEFTANPDTKVKLCATDSYLKMMKVELV
jgi:hypothetical protein